MKYLFAPVPAHGLGQSPGIETIPTITGTWNDAASQPERSWLLINPVAGVVLKSSPAAKNARMGSQQVGICRL